MRPWPLLLMLGAALHAATIRGVVLENQTSRPLARALVVIQPASGKSFSMRTNVSGGFEFAQLAPGAYRVVPSRTGFATPVRGVSVVIDESTPAQLELRLKRFGAIVGTVLDENEVGLSDCEVVAFRNTRPPQ